MGFRIAMDYDDPQLHLRSTIIYQVYSISPYVWCLKGIFFMVKCSPKKPSDTPASTDTCSSWLLTKRIFTVEGTDNSWHQRVQWKLLVREVQEGVIKATVRKFHHQKISFLWFPIQKLGSSIKRAAMFIIAMLECLLYTSLTLPNPALHGVFLGSFLDNHWEDSGKKILVIGLPDAQVFPVDQIYHRNPFCSSALFYW